MDERAGLAANGPVPEVAAGSTRGSLRRDLAGPLRGLLAGQCLGQCGDGLAQIAFAQFVLFDVGRGATPGRIAAVLAATLLPFSLVGPFAGVLLDRLDRRRTLVAVSVLRGLLVAVGAVVVAARLTAPAYLAVILLLSSSRLVLTAKGAALPRTVPRERLVPANALSALAGSSAAFLGAVGGSLFVGRSVVAGFFAAGVLYAGAATVFATLPSLGPDRPIPPTGHPEPPATPRPQPHSPGPPNPERQPSDAPFTTLPSLRPDRPIPPTGHPEPPATPRPQPHSSGPPNPERQPSDAPFTTLPSLRPDRPIPPTGHPEPPATPRPQPHSPGPPNPERQPSDAVFPRVLRTVADLVEGVRVVTRTPAIRRPLLAVGAHRLLLGAGFVVLVLVADSQYRLKASGYGIALAATGIATFAASAAAPALASRYGARALLPAAFLPAAAAAYVGGLFPSLWVLVACVAVAAFAFQVLKVCADALIGGATPDAARGRVFALYDLLYNLAFVFAGLAMVPWWHAGRERALLWWVAAGFTAGWAVIELADHGKLRWRRSRRARRRRRPRPRPRLRLGARPQLRGRCAALLAGGLPALAFPAPAWWWLAWVALVPLLLLVRAAPTRREGVIRAWWGLGGFEVATQYWLLPSIGPALGLLAVLLGALWLPWGWAVHRLLAAPLTGRRAAAALLVVPSAWTCAEAVRSWQSLGGPWVLLGATQWNQPSLLASASLGGVWLTGFLIALVNTAVVIVLINRQRVRLVAVVILLAVAVGPVWSAVRPALPAAGSVRIAVVQPGVLTSPTGRQSWEETTTAQLSSQHPDLVIWGESSLGYDLTADPALIAGLQGLAQQVNADLLVNGDATVPGTSSAYNTSALIAPDGLVGEYHKIRLVPFGEYIPLRPVLGWVADFSKAAPTNRVRGDQTTVMHSGSLAFGPLICFESAFPDLARTEVAHGAQLLVYQTSTSTFQGSWAQPQHASLAAVRAAETGRPAVQVGLTGVSAVFDAHGRQLAWHGAGYRGAFTTDVPLVSGSTPYQRSGDWMLAVAFTTLAAGATSAVFRARPDER
ncbi:apolipoprotein N-acyltransferase [Kitasatospora acidiphila]|nr:apolipoprotein N-acyltransferase [Kitasatospora acidiphila]